MEAAVVSSPGLPEGTRFGDFVSVRPLAAGGMAELYLAARSSSTSSVTGAANSSGSDHGPPELVAIKRLLPHLGWDPEFVRMFLDEVRIAASLHHPNIVQVIDFGVGEGGHYLAMEYLHGRTLRAIQRSIRASGPLPLGFSVGAVMEIAAGLHSAHEHHDTDGNPIEVVHRDVSPSNVMITFDGQVKLVDFGIARVTQQTQLTRAGTLKGKMGYMSPEQCRGEPVDRRSDVFGLGILLYELTVGRRAFYADNDYAVIGKVVDGDYATPSRVIEGYPQQLEAIIARALSIEAADRYPTAAALAQELGHYVAATQMDISIQSRAAVLYQRFGYEPPPAVDLDALVGETADRPTSGGWLRWAGLLGLGALIGGLGFVAGGLNRGDPVTPAVAAPAPESEPAPSMSPAVVAAPSTETPAQTSPGPTEETPDGTPDEDLDEDSADDSLLVIEDDESADGAAEDGATTPRRRRRRRRRPKDRDTTPSGNPNSLLPPTWRDQ